MGRFDSDAVNDLAVGMPGASSLVEPLMLDTGDVAADYVQETGAVLVWLGDPTAGLVPVEQVLSPYDHPTVHGSKVGAAFGSSLSAARFHENTGCDGLVVGAPSDLLISFDGVDYETAGSHLGTSVRTGQFYIYGKTVKMGSTWCGNSVELFGEPQQSLHDQEESELGFSLALGNLLTGPVDGMGLPVLSEDLVVGAPGTLLSADTGDPVLESAGAVYVLDSTALPSGDFIKPSVDMVRLNHKQDFAGECEAEGDRFGHAVATGLWNYANSNARDVLAVGALAVAGGRALAQPDRSLVRAHLGGLLCLGGPPGQLPDLLGGGPELSLVPHLRSG